MMIRFHRAQRFAARMRQNTHRLRNDTSGAAVVVAAILLPVVIGGMGLGAETGYWYLNQRTLQHAADVSVHAAAVRKRAGDSKVGIDAAALHVATESGFSSDLGTLVVNIPPASGPNAGDGNSIEVLIGQIRPRLFSAIFSEEPVLIAGRAVARLTGGSTGCVLALSRIASGAVTVSGSTEITLTGCDVASNSNAADSFLMSGSTAALSAGCVSAVGAAVTTSGLNLTECREVKEHASSVIDPYASVAEPAVTGTCRSKNVGSPNSSTTLTPTENHPSGVKVMRFCNGLDIKGKVTFEPGLYIIEGGDLTINSGDLSSSSAAELHGAGVTFYFTSGGRSRLGGNALLNLAAPSSGPFSGILFFGSRSATGVTQRITGTSGSTLQGALYFPAGDVVFRGNSKTSGGCTQVIGRTVTFSGNSSLQSSCETSGTKDIVTRQDIAIVE